LLIISLNSENDEIKKNSVRNLPKTVGKWTNLRILDFYEGNWVSA